MPQDLASKNQLLNEQINSLLYDLKQRRKSVLGEEATHWPQQTMGDKGRATLQYMDDVVHGRIAKRGLEKLAEDIKTPGGLIDYVGFGGIIAGPASKLANISKLKKAKALKEAGATREKIWEETGWFQYANDWKKGNRGWRFEIPDTAAVEGQTALTKEARTLPAGEEIPIEKAVSHNQLMAAYPEAMKDLNYSRQVYRDKGQLGQFDTRVGKPDIVTTKFKDEGFSVLHEIQHKIQRSEPEFVTGGSVSTVKRLAREEADKLAARLKGSAKDTPQEYRSKLAEQLIIASNIAENRAGSANKLYKRLAGEAEARMVQKRARMIRAYKGLGFNDEQINRALAKKPPWKTLDVPEEKMYEPKGLSQMRSALNENPKQEKSVTALLKEIKKNPSRHLKQQALDFEDEVRRLLEKEGDFTPAILKDQAY